ncbi:hypothetical protein HOY82DRAFT_608907 [Tuber indicum]|nr:hypothetical protein HOY82DRAFT_608907 [Tuber indicum]
MVRITIHSYIRESANTLSTRSFCMIPWGCTTLVQPLDVSINRPFKDILKEVLEEKLDIIEEDGRGMKALFNSCDSEISVKGVDNSYIIEGLKYWKQGGLEGGKEEENNLVVVDDGVELNEEDDDVDIFFK